MAERIVTVSLLARVASYVAGMEQAAIATRKATASSTDARAKFEAQNRAMTEVGRGLVAVGALAAVGVAIAVKKFVDFDRAISDVKAATQETTANMGLLREAALEAGADSIYTATEAANAIEELGKAGLSTADILSGALTGSLNLASAGNLDIARAAEISATTLSQFNLAGSATGHVADVLAAGAGKALGSVDDLANGLKFVGPVAASMNVSLEETTGVLALFAQQGIIGEQAGTGLRGMLSSLTSPSKIARDEIARLGITLYDTQGNFLGLENAAGQLQGAYKGATAQQRDLSLGILFGNEQITAARVLYSAGAKGVADWTEKVNDSGYASKVAADRLDNLSGDVEKLGGAFDTYLIKSGSAANDILRLLVQTATGAVDGLGQLPQPVLAVGLGLTALVAIVSLTGGTFLLAVPKVVAFKEAVEKSSLTMGGLARTAGVASGALAAATLIFGYFAAKQGEATANTAEFKESLDQTTGSITNYTRELVVKKLMEAGAFNAAKAAGVSQDELTEAVLRGGNALDEVNRKLNAANNIVDFWSGTGVAAGIASGSVRELTGALDNSKDQWSAQKAAADQASKSTQGAATAYKSAADKAAELQSNLSSLIDTMNKANGLNQNAESTNAAYRRSLDDVAASVNAYIEANGQSTAALDSSTAAGATNREMLADLAGKAQAAAEAALKAGGGQLEFQAALEAGHQAIYDTAFALTGSSEAALALADDLAAIPDQKAIAILMDTLTAQNQLDTFMRTNDGRTLTVNIGYNNTRGGYDLYRASGGPITGVGGPKQDNIHVMASVGEHMLTAEDVQRMGGHAGVYRFRQSLYQGLAEGGAVRPVYAQPLAVVATRPAPAPVFEVTLQSKGGIDLLEYVDVRIEQKDARDLQNTNGRFFR